MQARWGTHGDHPIIVLCPSSVKEAFELTIKAFNFSEKYRTPVILLMDEVVGHMREPIEYPPANPPEVVDRLQASIPPEWYYPYDEEFGDVPPMVPFGMGYRYHITGLHHNRSGFPTLRPDEIRSWVNRVFRKIEANKAEFTLYEEEWPDSRVLVIAYGATARAARHAVKMARARRYRIGFLKLLTLWPFPEEVVERAARNAVRVIVPEMNMGQIVLEVERIVGRRKVQRVNKVDGTMITPAEILKAIEGGAG